MRDKSIRRLGFPAARELPRRQTGQERAFPGASHADRIGVREPAWEIKDGAGGSSLRFMAPFAARLVLVVASAPPL